MLVDGRADEAVVCCADSSLPFKASAGDGHAKDRGLDRGARLGYPVPARGVHRRHDEPAVGHSLGEPFADQAQQSFANHREGHAMEICELLRPERLRGRHLAVKDRRAEGLVDPPGGRRARSEG